MYILCRTFDGNFNEVIGRRTSDPRRIFNERLGWPLPSRLRLSALGVFKPDNNKGHVCVQLVKLTR